MRRDDAPALLSRSAARLHRGGCAPGIGHRLHRLYPRPLPEEAGRAPAGAGVLTMPELDVQQEWIGELASLADEAARRELFGRHRSEHSAELVQALYEEVLRLGRIDLDSAQRVAEALGWLAGELDSSHARAIAYRA